MRNDDYLLESRLKELNPEMHMKYRNCVTVMSVALDHYANNFPHFTDHSMRHSMDVIEFSNSLVGEKNIKLLNAHEIFCLLMAIYLHDFGMGIAERDFMELIPKITGEAAPEEFDYSYIRKYHHELSAALIKKYAPIFDIEDETYIYAISQIARGHRVTDLLDEKEFPLNYRTSDGAELCLPYLAALIRLADEIDIGRERNPDSAYTLKYTTENNFTEREVKEYLKHYVINRVDVEGDCFRIIVENADEETFRTLMSDKLKIEKTLNQCLEAINGRTKFTLYQNHLEYERTFVSTTQESETQYI